MLFLKEDQKVILKEHSSYLMVIKIDMNFFLRVDYAWINKELNNGVSQGLIHIMFFLSVASTLFV